MHPRVCTNGNAPNTTRVSAALPCGPKQYWMNVADCSYGLRPNTHGPVIV